MSEDSTERIEKLVAQSKSNGGSLEVKSHKNDLLPIDYTDVDTRVDAITKLQSEFESGIEVSAFCSTFQGHELNAYVSKRLLN